VTIVGLELAMRKPAGQDRTGKVDFGKQVATGCWAFSFADAA